MLSWRQSASMMVVASIYTKIYLVNVGKGCKRLLSESIIGTIVFKVNSATFWYFKTRMRLEGGTLKVSFYYL